MPGATFDVESASPGQREPSDDPGVVTRPPGWAGLALLGAEARLWRCDLETGRIDVIAPGSPTRLAPGGIIPGTLDRFFDRVHPEDAARVRRGLGESLLRHTPFDLEFRLDAGSDRHRSIAVRGRPIARGGQVREVAGLALDVTGRSTGRLEARRTEGFALALLDSLPTQIAVLDGRGAILAVNKAWRDVGRAAGAPPVAEGADYLAVCDRAADSGVAEAAEFARAIREVLRGERSCFVREYALPGTDGDRWFEGRVVRFEGEGPPRAVVAHYEVTDRRRAEDSARALNGQLRARLGRGAALRRVDVAIASGMELGRVLDLIAAEARAQLRVDAVVVLRLAPSGQTLEPVRSSGLPGEALRPIGTTLAGRVVAENRPVGVADLRAELAAGPYASDAPARGFVAYRGVPLRSRGGPLGVLEVYLGSQPPDDPEWSEFLEILADQAAIAFQKARLDEERQRSNEELSRACEATIEGWSRALEMRDKETEGHSRRVTEMTLRLARELGVPEDRLVHVRRGALLHDIGKMGVPDRILLKPGPLSPEEWAIMQMHPTHALRMLWPIDFLRPALEIPYAHHERWDGTGYPRGLSGEEIPLPARIFAVVDVWDALSHDRPYRQAWSPESVRAHLRQLAGNQLDPAVVEAFLRCEVEADAAGAAAGASTPNTARPGLEPIPVTERPDDEADDPVGPTVLIAEQDPALRDSLQVILSEAGFQVRHTDDGRAAWEILQREDIAIVLTDWSLPGLDGLELCRRIRRREDHLYTYVILLADRTDSRDRLEGMRAGADDFLSKPVDPHELIARLEIARRILGMQRTIFERSAQAERLAAELRLQNERLAELAWTDGLTGLCNRRRFFESLESSLSLAARRGSPVSIALLDVDRFKQYNDAHGHQAGDEVLRHVAELLRRNVRAHDLAARHGGEEFIVLLPDTDAEAARSLAERLRASIDGHPWPLRRVTASVGVATADRADTRDSAGILDLADRALYHSKRSGRNRVTHFEQIRQDGACLEETSNLFLPVV